MGKKTEDPDIIMSAKGVNGTLYLLPGRIRIGRRGVLAFATHGLAGDKEIAIRQISSVQWKKPGLTNGYIQFAFIGGTEGKKAVFQATQDENTIMFNSGQAKAFEAIKKAVEAEIYAPTDPQPVPASSDLDDLEKLADLRDKGIITDEEFAAKKKQLLGI